MIEPRCLNPTKSRPPLFQDLFVGLGKWFRGASMACGVRTRRGERAGHGRDLGGGASSSLWARGVDKVRQPDQTYTKEYC
jgi:hypothetical protein